MTIFDSLFFLAILASPSLVARRSGLLLRGGLLLRCRLLRRRGGGLLLRRLARLRALGLLRGGAGALRGRLVHVPEPRDRVGAEAGLVALVLALLELGDRVDQLRA